MPFDDASFRGRLLTESSTNAFAALRERAAGSLARVRLAAGAAFCLIAAALSLAGATDLGISFWPLLIYALASWAVFRGAGRGGWGGPMAILSPLVDVLFIFVLQMQALGSGPSSQFGAGWTLGLYALLVCFSALTLRARVVTSTSAVAFVLLAVLQARGGTDWTGIAASGVVLALIATASVAVVRELDRLVVRLVVNEVRHEELRSAQSEAETLTNLLVHDMKGPLTGLIGLAEVVRSEVPPQLRGDMKMIEEQGRRLQSMVSDLLAIAKLERGVLQSAPETVDLSALLASLGESYGAPARQAGAQIEVAVEPGLSALVHREMVHRLLDNLLLNALDFVRPGGRIQLAAWAEDAELRLAVRNTGDPVPPGVRPRLFEKGASYGERRRQNSGLGLYLCRLVAVAHDGGIGIVDEPGWAASFVARLPIQARRSRAALTPFFSRVGGP